MSPRSFVSSALVAIMVLTLTGCGARWREEDLLQAHGVTFEDAGAGGSEVAGGVGSSGFGGGFGTGSTGAGTIGSGTSIAGGTVTRPGATGATGGPSAASSGSRPSSGAAPGSAGGATGSGAGSGSGATAPAPAGGSTTGGATAPPPAAAGGEEPASASGEPIMVGFVIFDTTGLAALTGTSNAGAQDSNSAESQSAADTEIRALVDWANASGGVGGRQIEYTTRNVTVADAANQDALEAHCVALTEDEGVTAFFDHNMFVNGQRSLECWADHGVTFIGPVAGTDRPYLTERLAPYVATTWLTIERTVRSMVEGLDSLDYFEGAVLGVAMDDLPMVRTAYEQQLVPRLRDLGVEVTAEAAINPDNPSAGAANAVLSFRAAGVTHVISLMSLLPYLQFTSQAESQGYHPRYGIGEYASGTSLAAFYGAPTQNVGAIGVGATNLYVRGRAEQQTVSDGTYISRDNPYLLDGIKRCMDVLSEQTGTDYYSADTAKSVSIYFYCDHFFLWLEAARNVGAAMTPDSWAEGLAPFGTSYASTVTAFTEFTPGRFDGAAAYRPGIYDQPCMCFLAEDTWLPLGY